MRKYLSVGCLVLLAGWVLVRAPAQDRPQPMKLAADDGISKATQTYVDAFNKGDVDGMLSVWSADAEYVDDAGQSTKGKTALAAMFRKVFQDNKGIKLEIKTTAVRMLKEDVAMQDGQSIFIMASGDRNIDAFTTVWLKKEGKWLISVVHDLTPPAADEKTGSAALKDLAWLIGTWAHEDKDMQTSVVGRWLKGEKFVNVDYTVRSKGEEILSVTQIIGWDPTGGGKLHSWVFDSRGGFGEGVWTREGNVWTVQTSGVTADGRLGSGKMIWTFVDNDHFIHEGVDRTLDGQPLPDHKTRYERVKK